MRSRSGPPSFRLERVEARLVAKGEVEVTARGAAAPWRVPSPQGLAFSVAHNGSGALDGESLMGAVMFTVEPRGERLLLIHTAMEANCETQLALFLLGEKGPELIASAARDCDV